MTMTLATWPAESGHDEAAHSDDVVICDGCRETRVVVLADGRFRADEWPVCREEECTEHGQVMRLMWPHEVDALPPRPKHSAVIGGFDGEERAAWKQNYAAARERGGRMATERAKRG